MKMKIESDVAQSCLTLSNPMDCSLPGSSVHGIFQARVLEWGAIAFSANTPRCPSSAGSSQKDLDAPIPKELGFLSLEGAPTLHRGAQELPAPPSF